jgi:IS30 family transposase
MIRHGRSKFAQGGQSKLTLEQVDQIRAMLAGDLSLRAIGRCFGVTHATIRDIKLGKIWRRPRSEVSA